MLKPLHTQRGFAILLAILLVSIVLTVGLTLFNITYRQLILSSLARESQFAFYAADSARTCARHYDNLPVLTERPFGYRSYNGSENVFIPPDGTVRKINCGGVDDIEVEWTTEGTGADNPWEFNFIAVFDSGDKQTCAEVRVRKYLGPYDDDHDDLIVGSTSITSRGYNNYSGDLDVSPCHLANDRTVERASLMVY